jgi:putative CocE/NonD family hydrolase
MEYTQVLAPLTPAPPNKFESEVLDGGEVLFEKDHAIPMRDGIKLYADILRPVDSIAKVTPTIVFFGPFGKHGAVPRELFKNMDVDFSKLSKYTKWELPDPLLWCGKYEFSFAIVDPRGTWWSEGDAAHYLSPEEGRDGYDVVEWIAKQPWYDVP